MNSLTNNLQQWPLPPTDTVAWRQGQPISRDQLLREVNTAQQALAQTGSARIALYEEDAYCFAVWLLACWENGQTAVLPPDDLPDYRQRLVMPWIGPQDWPQHNGTTVGEVKSFGQPGVEMFTSGSTGEPGVQHKTLAQLRNEADTLQQLFGHDLPDNARFAASVPHQHMFGLMFRLLWPLTHGYPFYADTAKYPARLADYDPDGLVLISSPTLLKRLEQCTPDGFYPHMIFSAGGVLPDATAAACRSQLCTRVIEIYGSTETGSVARRDAPGGRWLEQPGVTLSIAEDGECLCVASPFLPAGVIHQAQDRVRLDDNGWHFLGRADRIVKIEGKRISLDAIERALLEQPEITQAKALALHRERDEIAVAAVLSDSGTTALAEMGKARFDRLLRRRLCESIGRVALPRRWRYLHAMPQDGMGKIRLSALQALFNEHKLPTVHDVARQENGVELTLYLDPAIHWFKGHFPDLPVLPGVAQVDWAVHYGRRYFAISGQFGHMLDLRFQKLTRPGLTIRLHLHYDDSKRQLRFSYRSELGEHSRGRIIFDGETS